MQEDKPERLPDIKTEKMQAMRETIEGQGLSMLAMGNELREAQKQLDAARNEISKREAELARLRATLQLTQGYFASYKNSSNELIWPEALEIINDALAGAQGLRVAAERLVEAHLNIRTDTQQRLDELRVALAYYPQPDDKPCAHTNIDKYSQCEMCGQWGNFMQPDTGAQGDDHDTDPACDECDWDCEQRFHSHAPSPSPEAAPTSADDVAQSDREAAYLTAPIDEAGYIDFSNVPSSSPDVAS